MRMTSGFVPILFCLENRTTFEAKLRMVRAYAQISEEQLLAARMLASTIRLDRYENSVDILQRLRIIRFQHPAFLADIVLIKDSEASSLQFVRPSPAPCLKRTRVLKTRLRV